MAAPATFEEAAAALEEASANGWRIRFRGGGTKLGWGRPTPEPDLEVSTARLDRIIEHNGSDLTAVLQAGVPLARAQSAFAEAGQMIALDPPLGEGGRATIGGILATADSGPLRHLFKGPRDLVLGVTVCLADGTVAKSGGKVIKNVAGYDLGKLFCGSFGTLGLILAVAVRLHPRAVRTASVVGGSENPAALGRAASALSHSPLFPECLDVGWSQGAGRLVVRFGGSVPEERAERALGLMDEAGLAGGMVEDDGAAWAVQRAGQRNDRGVVVKVSGSQTGLARVLEAARAAGGSVVGRAGLGLSWVRLEDAGPESLVGRVGELRARLVPFPCVVLDAPVEVRERLDPWDGEASAHRLMRRVKESFDPQALCNPGVFVGGI